MKLRFATDTYLRCCGDESLLWHKRNASCMILRGAEVFLRFITWEWRDSDDIVNDIAGVYAMAAAELQPDFQEFVQPLIANGLVEYACEKKESSGEKMSDIIIRQENVPPEQNDSWTPLGDFFENYKIPCELHIDLTSACTERCVHCYIPEYANRFLDFEMVRKALDEFKALGGLSVHLSGGECMMHPDFDRIVRYCKEQNINMIILSNLTLCDENKIALLKEVDPQFINVSLYSMNPEQHDAVTRVPGSWQRTMEAILKCETAGIHIRLAAPVLKENKEGYGALVQFAREHHMHLIPDVDIFPQCNHDDSNMEHALSAEELREFLEENRNFFVGLIQGRTEIPAPEAKVCDVGRARICLDSQGHYYPCDGSHGLVLGDIRKNSLSEVWNGEKFNALRALKNRDFPSCVACENRLHCKVCPAHNFNATGDILRHSPQKCALAAVKCKLFRR